MRRWGVVGILVTLAVVFLVHRVSPRLGEAVAWMIVVGFLFPLFTFGGGVVTWFFYNLFSASADWSAHGFLTCCACFGLPLAAIVAWFVLKKE